MAARRAWFAAVVAVATAAPAPADRPEPPANNSWYSAAQNALRSRVTRADNRGAAKNVIVFIGDGMDLTTVTAARIFAGQEQGETGEEGLLVWERQFPHSGLVKTYNVDTQVPDSAGTASALFTGVKTRMGVLGVDDVPLRGDCEGSLRHTVPNIGEWVKSAGKGLGIVSTAALTDATPGAVYAHSADRLWQASAPAPCVDIASQLVRFNVSGLGGWDVALGGGRINFVPQGREDQADLVTEWLASAGDGAQFVETTEDLADAEPREGPVLGLFANTSMDFEADRDTSPTGQPSLSNMTRFAIEALASRFREQGYFLMVEAGRIDHGSHATDGYRALTEAVELDRAVTAALDIVDTRDTLLVVTSDHGHTTFFGGYAVRGNPILGLLHALSDTTHVPERDPMPAADGKPWTALGYGAGPGGVYPDGVRRPDLTGVDTEAKGFMQQASVPLKTEPHGGADVAVWAVGPESRLFASTMEQNLIFHIVTHALSLQTDPSVPLPGTDGGKALRWSDQTVAIVGSACLVVGVAAGVLISRACGSSRSPRRLTAEEEPLLSSNRATAATRPFITVTT